MSRSVTRPSTPMPSLCGVLTMRFWSVRPFTLSGANRRANAGALMSADDPALPERLDLGRGEARLGEDLVAVLAEACGPRLHGGGRVRKAEGRIEAGEGTRPVGDLG